MQISSRCMLISICCCKLLSLCNAAKNSASYESRAVTTSRPLLWNKEAAMQQRSVAQLETSADLQHARLTFLQRPRVSSQLSSASQTRQQGHVCELCASNARALLCRWAGSESSRRLNSTRQHMRLPLSCAPAISGSGWDARPGGRREQEGRKRKEWKKRRKRWKWVSERASK